jgi:hypothetical protein
VSKDSKPDSYPEQSLRLSARRAPRELAIAKAWRWISFPTDFKRRNRDPVLSADPHSDHTQTKLGTGLWSTEDGLRCNEGEVDFASDRLAMGVRRRVFGWPSLVQVSTHPRLSFYQQTP